MNKKQITVDHMLRQYKLARGNLLLMTLLTLVNVVLFAVGSETMLLFSATVPYFAAVFGIASEISELAIIGIAVAAIFILVYFLCWLFSKKHYGWMVAALVLFSLDTIALVALYLLAQDVSGILDALIHIWVFYYLIIGVVNGAKLRKLPPTELEPLEELNPAASDPC